MQNQNSNNKIYQYIFNYNHLSQTYKTIFAMDYFLHFTITVKWACLCGLVLHHSGEYSAQPSKVNMHDDRYDLIFTYTVTLETVNRAYAKNYVLIAQFILPPDDQQFLACNMNFSYECRAPVCLQYILLCAALATSGPTVLHMSQEP